jgi:hypothetical protein
MSRMMKPGPPRGTDLLLAVPEKGLSGAEVGNAVAARIGAKRRPGRARSDDQPRSRRRGSTSSL